MMDHKLLFAAKYPFTDEAKKLVEIKSPDMTPSLIAKAEVRAYEGIMDELKTIPKVAPEEFMLQAVYTYPLANIVVASLNNYNFSKKYAENEAKRAVVYLKLDVVAREQILHELNLEFQKTKYGFSIDFISFLKHAPLDKKHKLVNSKLVTGIIYINEKESYEILENSIKNKILSAIPFKKTLPGFCKGSAERVRRKLPVPKVRVRFSGDIAPCMDKLIKDMRAGISLNHNARWSLAVFLVRIGWNNEQILGLFSNSPNFDARTTEYQINYIREKEYLVPSCETLRGYGIYHVQCGARHPLSYRGRKK